MRIAVCIKQVPETSDLKIDPETNTLMRQGVASVLNPLDEFPLEAALRLRESLGGEVVAFTMGPPQARAVLETAIALGVDDVVLLSDRRFAGADTWATSLVLARALAHKGPFDLILCGKQAVDGDTAQVGPGVAAHMNIAQATYVTHIDPQVADQRCPARLRVTRLMDHGDMVADIQLPAVLTVLKEANEPRMPDLMNRIRSMRQRVPTLNADDLELQEHEIGIEGSPTRVVRIAVPESTRQKRILHGASRANMTAVADRIISCDNGE